MDKEAQEKMVELPKNPYSGSSAHKYLEWDYPYGQAQQYMLNAGYRKIKDKPPLLTFKKGWCKDPPTLAEPDRPINCPENCEYCKLQAQREADIKWYED